MLRILGTSRSILALLLALGGYYAYHHLNDNSGSDSSLRTKMAAQVCRQAALAIPIPDGRPMVAIAQANGDFDGIVTKQLRLALERRNATVIDLAPWDSVMPTRLKWSLETTPERATANAAARNVPYVVSCRVDEWVTDPVASQNLNVHLSLIDVAQNVFLYQNEFSLADCENSPNDRTDGILTSVEGTEDRSDALTGIVPSVNEINKRILLFAAWLVGGLALPWLGSNFITMAMRSHSNLAGFALVAIYLGAVAGAAWFTWGQFESRWVTGAVLAVLSSAWLGYFEFVCRSVSDGHECRA